MRELSLHILDIVENATAAGAKVIRILVQESRKQNLLKIRIRDNGPGMPNNAVQQATHPFYTTRTTRRVGLGLSLLETAAKRCDGRLQIVSSPENGTEVTATFKYDHIDRAPLGDMAPTLTSLFSGHRKVDFIYHHLVNRKHFMLNSQLLQDDHILSNPRVLAELTRVIRDKIDELEPNTTP